MNHSQHNRLGNLLSLECVIHLQGYEHEKKAGNEYERKVCKKMFNHSIIPLSCPLMGTSPDSTVKCKCSGFGVLEIKCPYSCHSNGEILLNVYHAYYFQNESKFNDAQYCDFIVWNVDDLFVQYLDEPFITVALKKSKQFIKKKVYGEIVFIGNLCFYWKCLMKLVRMRVTRPLYY